MPRLPPLWQIRSTKGPVADDSGAQERSGLLVAEGGGNGVGIAFVYYYVVGIAPIEVPPGEEGGDAQILPSGHTEPAHSTGLSQPGHTDSVSWAEADRARSEFVDDADHLVAWDNSIMIGRQITLRQVEIGAAHPADLDMEADVTRLGDGHSTGDLGEGV
jgi:hypothetical protein